MYERPTPDASEPGKTHPPPGAPWCRPHSAQSQLARACALRLVVGPQAHIPRTQSPRVADPVSWEDARSGEKERPTPDSPHPSKRCPPRAPLCHPHSAQSQFARARAMGLVMAPRAHTPHTHSQWVAGLGRTPQGRAVGRGRAPNTGRPTPSQEAPAPGHLRAAARARKASSQEDAGSPQEGKRPQAKQGDEGTGPPSKNLIGGAGDRGRKGGGARTYLLARSTRIARSGRATPTRRVGGGVRHGSRNTHTHATATRCGPKGQPDRARGAHIPHGMAYRQAKGRDTRAGQPATRTARDVRAGRSSRGEARTGHPDLPRAPRHTTRALHPPGQ